MEEDEIMDDSDVNMVTNETPQEDSGVLTVINRRCPTFHVNVNGNQEELIDTMVNNLPSFTIIKDIANQNFLKAPIQAAIQGMPATRTLQNSDDFFGSPLSESPVEYNDNRLSQLSLIQPSPHLATKNSQVLNQVSMNVLNIAINHMIQHPYPKLPLRMVVSQPAQRYPAIEDKKVMPLCGNSASDSEPLSQTIIDLFNKPIMFNTVTDICKPVEMIMRRRKPSVENSFHNSSLEQYSSLYGKKEKNDRSLVSVAEKKVYIAENPFTPPNWLLNKFLSSQPDSSPPDVANQPNADDPVKDDTQSQGAQTNKMECLVFHKEQTSPQLENGFHGNTDTFFTENRKDNENEEFDFKPDLEPQVYFNFRDERYVNKVTMQDELSSKKRKYVTSEDFITVPKNYAKKQCLEIDYIQTNVEEETELSCIGSSFSDQSLSLDLSMERLRQTFEDSEDESMDI